MRILITGGAGFIGSHLCDRFIKDGHQVICIDNFITGVEANISHLIGSDSFELIKHDIAKPYRPEVSLDWVLHFASPASPLDYLQYPIQTLKVGSLGTLNAIGIAKANKAKFFLASTSEVYGDPQVHPQPEDYWGHVNCVGPRGVYDEAKRFAEALTMAYHKEHGVDTRIIRIFNTFGLHMRRDDGRAIPSFIDQALQNKPITVFGDGSQTRSFCYVSDLVDGIRKLMESSENDPVNVGNPNEMTLKELAQIIIRLTKSSSEIVYKDLPLDDPKVRQPDITRATNKLNWSPKVSLESGLEKTIEWFASSRVVK